MNDKAVAAVSKILTEWNPLGSQAASIPDLDGYQTEAIDILFAINLSLNSDSVATIVQTVLNQAFDLSLELTVCIAPAKAISDVIKKFGH